MSNRSQKAISSAGTLARLKEGWMRFAHTLGRINSTILLTVVFFFVLGPVAILHRAMGPDRMGLKKSGTPPRFKPSSEASADEAASLEWARRQF